jgi:C-terminal processing protease CtpA/Prc
MSEALRRVIDAEQGTAAVSARPQKTTDFDVFGLCKGCSAWLNKHSDDHPVLRQESHDESLTNCGKEMVVEFDKGELGLQFEVEEGGSSIVVKQIIEGSQASDVCLINIGDELVGINSHSLVRKHFDEAMATIKRVVEHEEGSALRLHFHPHPDREKAAYQHVAADISQIF